MNDSTGIHQRRLARAVRLDQTAAALPKFALVAARYADEFVGFFADGTRCES